MAACVVKNTIQVLFLATVFLSSFLKTTSHQIAQLTDSLDDDIQALAKALPGCYSNVKQFYARARVRFPVKKRHQILLRAEYYKMERPLFNDSLTIYFQHFTQSASRPFGSGFYSFVADKKMNVIRMRLLRFQTGVFETVRPSHNFIIPSQSATGLALKKRSQDKVMLRQSSCNMYWKMTSDLRFYGITGSQCLASQGKGKDRVQISVSMTVSDSKLMLTQGWYNVKNGKRVSQDNVPYLLAKKPHPPKPIPKPYVAPNSSKLSRFHKDKLNGNTFELPEHSSARLLSGTTRSRARVRMSRRPTNIMASNGSANTFIRKKMPPIRQPRILKTKRNRSRSCKEKPSKKNKTLRNFRHVLAALTSGHDVSFHVDINGCRMPNQLKLDRRSFGGKVTDFVYTKERKSSRRKDRIYFSTMKTAMSFRGMEFITREITIVRGNRVEVKVTTEYAGNNRPPLKYIFQCRLFNERKRRGSVRMSSSPGADIKMVSVLDNMTSLLRQGHDLRLVTDFSKCQGSKSNSAVIVGSHITDYDMVNGGKTLEVFLPVDRAVAPNFGSGRRNGYNGRIFKNGDVTLTWVSARKEDGLQTGLRMSSAYRCTVSSKNQLSTNETGGSSISIFYRK